MKMNRILDLQLRRYDVAFGTSGLHQVCEPVDWSCDRRRGMSFSARSHVCDRRKRSPPFLLSDGCSTLSQIVSNTPLSNHRTSLSEITTWRTSLAVYHRTSQLTHKPDEVRGFRTQRRNVLTISPVFDSFSLLITTTGWIIYIKVIDYSLFRDIS